jgi:hypothetical protein
MRIGSRIVLLAMISLFACGCPVQPGLIPGSKPYEPLPKFEARFYSSARRDVFPDEARAHPELYDKTLVAWTGIVRQIEHTKDTDGQPMVKFTAEHHYFDWIEDIGLQREVYFLSPRGEGQFLFAWGDKSDEENQKFLSQFEVGDMVVVYGYPAGVHDGNLYLYPTENMRSVKPKWFTTTRLDYGRNGASSADKSPSTTPS